MGMAVIQQVQCPNCNGYRVRTITLMLDHSSGKVIRTDFLSEIVWGLLALFLGISLFFVIILLVAGIENEIEGINISTVMCLSLIVIPLVTGVVVWGIWSNKRKALKQAQRLDTFDCRNCGYRWNSTMQTPEAVL